MFLLYNNVSHYSIFFGKKKNWRHNYYYVSGKKWMMAGTDQSENESIGLKY